MEEEPDLRSNAEREPFKYFEFDDELDPNDYGSAMGLLDNLRRKQFSLKDAGITSRVFNNWRKEGIIPESPEDGKWAYFDFIQYLWLQIIKDFRQFGLPLVTIAKVKDFLFDEDFLQGSFNEEQKTLVKETLEEKLGHPFTDEEVQDLEKEIKFLENNHRNTFLPYRLSCIVLDHFMYRSKVNLTISLSGQVSTWSEKINRQREEIDEPYITVPLHYYFSKFISEKTKTEFSKPGTAVIPVISEEEAKVLKALRSELDQEVTVKYRSDEQYQIIELTTKRGKDLPTQQAKEIVERLYGKEEYRFSIRPKKGGYSYLEITKRKRIKTRKNN